MTVDIVSVVQTKAAVGPMASSEEMHGFGRGRSKILYLELSNVKQALTTNNNMQCLFKNPYLYTQPPSNVREDKRSGAKLGARDRAGVDCWIRLAGIHDDYGASLKSETLHQTSCATGRVFI
jgi:hypothetical protein